MPAPKSSALAAVVVTVPLLADVLVPEAEVPTSNGLTGSRPLYSRRGMSIKGVAVLKVTVTVLPAGAAAPGQTCPARASSAGARWLRLHASAPPRTGFL